MTKSRKVASKSRKVASKSRKVASKSRKSRKVASKSRKSRPNKYIQFLKKHKGTMSGVKLREKYHKEQGKSAVSKKSGKSKKKTL